MRRRSLTPPAVMPNDVCQGQEYRRSNEYVLWWQSQNGRPAKLLPPVVTKDNMKLIFQIRYKKSAAAIDEYCSTPQYSSDEETWEEQSRPSQIHHQQEVEEVEESMAPVDQLGSPRAPVRDIWSCSCSMMNHISFAYCQGCSSPYYAYADY
eukprot:TRINITY_DN5061_c1_g1_i1.p1 TRINITY_DN5061_c1_g1~~TRINITY_DN5061_c1_g1_i1.p1  ORF type:complete len:151 (+),score=19.52 TRINITY_DN5061_c1_g1_i1:119-571(+)